MAEPSINHQRISENATSFQQVYDGLMDVMASVKAGTMTTDQGEVIAKAGFGAAKVIESDLHARIFAHKLEGTAPRKITHAAG